MGCHNVGRIPYCNCSECVEYRKNTTTKFVPDMNTVKCSGCGKLLYVKGDVSLMMSCVPMFAGGVRHYCSDCTNRMIGE